MREISLGWRVSRGWFLIRNSQSSTGVDVIDGVAIVSQFADKFCDPCHRLGKRGDVGDLRADVNTDSGGFEMGHIRNLRVESTGLADRNAELVGMKAGRDIRMRIGGHVWVHAERNAGHGARLCGALCKNLKL